MNGAFLERSRPGMAMQAFAVIVGTIELDGLGNRSEILHVDVTEAAKLRENRSVHNVVRMAGVASFFAGDAGVLKMRSGHVRRVINMKAPAVRVHHVAREAELRLLGTLHMLRGAHRGHDYRQQKINDERELFAAACGCKRGTKRNRGDK